MKTDPFPFVSGSYQARSPRFDAQRTVNLYPEMSGSGTSKTIAMLIGAPGTKDYEFFIGAGTDVAIGIRGMLRFSSTVAIVVSGPFVYKYERIEGVGTQTLLGTIPLKSSPVSMASNGLIVMLVTGAEGYFIDPLANTFTLITDPDFHSATVVWFIDGYFVFNWAGTQKYQITQLYGTDIEPLDFASAEGSPDLLVSLIVDHKEVWLMGETSTEVHFNSGNADFPFEPIQGAFIEQGCAAPFSVAKLTDQNGAGTVIWLTANESGHCMVVRTVGYQPRRISDHALEFAIQSYSKVDDAIAYTYQQEGHTFYVLTFPTESKTWVYDTSTELWHQRAFNDPISGTAGRHRSNCHMFFDGKNLVGDYGVGMVYEYDLDTYYDSGAPYQSFLNKIPLVSIRQCPHLSLGDVWQVFHEFWLDMDTGVGLINGVPIFTPGTPVVGTDPTVILEWSDDGGYTFPYSRTIKIGKAGERKLRASARRLGKSKDRVFRVTISDPVKRIFLGAGVRMTPES